MRFCLSPYMSPAGCRFAEAHFLRSYCTYNRKNNLPCVHVSVHAPFFSPTAAARPCRAEDDFSINPQVQTSSISGGDGVLRNVTAVCWSQTITVKYLLLLFVCAGASSHLGFKGKRADGVIKAAEVISCPLAAH